MAENTAIEWADHTFNPWIGCTKVSPGCDHCYAETRMDKRLHRVQWGAGQPRQRTKTWGDPVRWNKQPFVQCMGCGWRGEQRAAPVVQNPPGFHPPVDSAPACPQCKAVLLRRSRARVFCASLADVFDNEVDPAWRADLFRLILDTPHLDWLLLTKRIGNAAQMMFLARGGHLPLLPNVWLGATVVNQAEADRDIPKLLATPASVRFLSIEPMLGPIDLQKPCTGRCPNRSCFQLRGSLNERCVVDSEAGGIVVECICSRLNGLHWVIAGGESGPGARPMHPDWARSLRDQCAEAGVPFMFKQHGEWIGAPDLRRLPGGGMPGFGAFDHCKFDMAHEAVRVGKKAAGRLLDGRTHDGFPA